MIRPHMKGFWKKLIKADLAGLLAFSQLNSEEPIIDSPGSLPHSITLRLNSNNQQSIINNQISIAGPPASLII